ncbi:MAG: DNA-nicking endonuclease, Smr domain [Candidatus Midichloria mitochondrii]|uniref:Smr/mutS family protein n=2 Tax=Candidatus Midichloria mitochondrii TaxID=234827 RepID=F7XU12_MIDMI|nr:Smr/mutS family protein [Candidatus Midichloria mitochondrii IricVA]MDJ1256875.1 Smr/MutS family protein [Candidatus Midichloria mitochondrii]MDJ1288610.1 Smr/MutS family protein [Candidatus Midichloria mitochondrii]
MSSKKWLPNDFETEFWQKVTKDIKKHKQSKLFIKEPNTERPVVITRELQPSPDRYNYTSRNLVLDDDSDIDHSTVKDIKRGRYPMDAKLDLHGYNLENALRELEQFIIASWQSKFRLVVVITGKGSGGGSIKDMIITWLNYKNIRSYILRVGTASPKHGGTGAFYVLLKRNRKKKVPTNDTNN